MLLLQRFRQVILGSLIIPEQGRTAGQGSRCPGGANYLLSELFQAPYFCIQTDEKHFALAQTLAQSQVVNHFKQVASELEVVLPISFFERQKSGAIQFHCHY